MYPPCQLDLRARSLCVWECAGLRGKDLNLRPPGYEPGELPDCSTPRAHSTGPFADGSTRSVFDAPQLGNGDCRGVTEPLRRVLQLFGGQFDVLLGRSHDSGCDLTNGRG